ncbi:hypothetical protein CTI12_AA583220 [Artemisia annua]|uniref:Condensin-2 complex subunit H2 n=1 Tax=Artemisia annua TaxID=35608 RepID=A0A2U1KN85_ARTAN|nr:hypothetical protein CTI12_AA583220 [Artemisia annua]
MNDKEASTSDAGAGKIHTVQAHRDLQSNWEVDIANKLQDYLLKICSGEINHDDNGLLAVNFAEGCQQHDQPESSSGQAEEQNGSVAAPPESDESFWCSDDIPVDPKNSLDSTNDNNTLLHSVKPPANLVVLEGDCLDVNGDSGELETYLLATNDLFRDFILLDASDAVTVDEFLGGKETFNKNKSGLKGGSSIGSKSRKSFMSPSKRSGGTVRKPSAAKTPNPDQNHSARVDNHFETNDHNMPDYNANMDHEFDMDDGFSQPEGFDDSDEEDDDPWKPLNPHEQGNLKVKPFKKVKAFRKEWSNPTTKISITEEFPLAKLHGPVSAELHEIWEAQHNVNEKDKEPQSPPLYEKLRRSLVIGDHVIGDHESNDVFKNDKDKHEEGDGYGDGGAPDIDTGFMDEDDFDPEKQPIDDATQCDSKEPFEHEDPNAHVNLEDLCRSHLVSDSLLASCTETEKQSALAARVSTWKQRIEKNLDEQDARPPFDIHEYGQRTLDKLSQEADVGKSLAFTDVVRGQEKHEVARTFSALLQLVNNGNVELIKGGGVNGQFVCYTGENPFHVRLLSNIKRPEVQLRSSNKRPKPQLRREKENNIPGTSSSPSPSPSSSSQISVKVGKVVGIRCTPESKRRRRSRLVDPDGLNSVG